MRRCLLLTMCVLPFMGRCLAQWSNTPFNPKDSANTFALKAKVLPWVVVGSGINYTLGVEYGFAKRHSIGVDAVYNDFSTPHEIYDTVTQQYTPGPRLYEVHRALFLNYRVYGGFEKWRAKGCTPYLSLFGRYGKVHHYYEPGYEDPDIAYEEWHYSGGLLFGLIMGNAGEQCFDLNIGPSWKVKDIRRVYNVDGAEVTEAYRKNGFALRVGMNLYFWGRRGW